MNTPDLPALDIERLEKAVARDAAFRLKTRLVPAGGAGDKVFPPTYSDGTESTKYVFEDRRVGDRIVRTVLLDSVASQANRLELALLEALDEQLISMPLLQVDFSGVASLADLDRITTLEAPHRIADAIFRDSVLDGIPFRATSIGRAFEDATPRNATAMYRYCPHALVFGCWDSTGPKGGLGSKFQRVLVSEIIGMDAMMGKKTASRLDPLGIQSGVDVFHLSGSKKGWTIDPEEAEKDGRGRPKTFGSKGNASEINHSNVPPCVDAQAGGVTIDHALHTAILSLVGLRQLHFPVNAAGGLIPRSERRRAEQAVRTVLAALGLAAIAFGRRRGYHLRSRALLLALEPPCIELLDADGGEPVGFRITGEDAAELLATALARAAALGFPWSTEPVTLQPSKRLVALIERSRALAAETSVEGA